VNSAHHANRDRLAGALVALEKKVEWVEVAPEPRAATPSVPFRLSFLPATEADAYPQPAEKSN
jgi:hypothetical protein